MIETFSARRRATVAALLFAPALLAVDTKFWQQGDFSDFEKGNLKNLALQSDGRLMLAPAVRELFDTSTPYLWAAVQDSRGNLYVAGGGPTASTARVFEIDAQGKSRTVADLDGLEVHALAVDRQDRVYAATVPDGKIYRIAGTAKPEVFFDPKAKYIWAMAFNPAGDLFVATGDRGEIYRVTPDGKGAVFFRTEETHARSLAIDAQGNLIVGTEPGGLILRISPKGDGFVLYQANKREVTAVAVAPDGSIYAAAVGSKPTGTSTGPGTSTPAPAVTPIATVTVQAPGAPRPAGPAVPPPSLGSAAPSLTGGSEIDRISPDGSPRRVWSHSTDIVYALAFDRQGRLIAGTGNKGNVYRVDNDHTYTLLENLAPTQVTGFAAGRDGSLYAVTGNVGKVYRIGPETAASGTYESEVYDAGAFSYWGRLIYRSNPKSGVSFEARSGNMNQAQKNWSPWTPVPLSGDGGRIAAPPARFIQYRATLTGSGGPSPELLGVDVAYMPKNLAPEIEEVEITPANYKFSAPPALLTTTNTITLPALGQRKPAAPVEVGSASVSMTAAKGFMGARWAASDENGDTLSYNVEIKGVRENDWKPLHNHIKERFLSFDSTAFPDGEYVIRVTASDAPSNPPGQALTASLVSDPFLIDNTPPEITAFAGTASGNKLNVSWRARDALSIISKAEYSVNGGEWLMVEPVTRLSDAPELEYRLTIDRPTGANEATVAVRVTDEYDNQSVRKVVIR